MRTLLIVSTLLLTACASTRPAVKPVPPTESIELDPTLIKAEVENGEVVGSTVLDSQTVNRQAIRAYKKRRYDEAIAKYAIIIESFPDSQY